MIEHDTARDRCWLGRSGCQPGSVLLQDYVMLTFYSFEEVLKFGNNELRSPDNS